MNLPPIIAHYDKRRQHVYESVRYNGDQWLDIWRPKGALMSPAPVLLFVPGGAWMIGSRRGQGHELMSHLVEQGWICVAIDYRTAPLHRWPAPFVDVMSALRWTRRNIARFGGDPNFVAMMGASAGGHMASLAGLTFPGADRVGKYSGFASDRPDAVISLYGVYDWTFRGSAYHAGFGQVLEKVIVGRPQRKDPETYLSASPIYHVRPDAPPFLVIHGTRDWLTPVSGSRRFVLKLRAISGGGVSYHEIPGAPHAFDLINPTQAKSAIQLIDQFLSNVRHRKAAA